MNAPLRQGRGHARRLAALLVASALASIVLVAQTPRTLGVDSSGFDRSIRPQDDFNGFVNGTWMRRTEIPPDRSTWGSFPELSEKSEAALKEIVDTALKTPATAGSERQQVADFYSSFMVTRKGWDGKIWGANQKVSVSEAIAINTFNGAWASGEESLKGSITAGKLADYVVLADDPHTIDPEKIKDIQIVRTVVGGTISYQG